MAAVENLAEYLPEQIKTRDVVCMPASEAEYLDSVPEFPGKLAYQNGEIIAMSLATAIQNHPYLPVYERTDQSDAWLNTDYKTLDSTAKLGDLTLPLHEIYHKI